MQKIWNNKARSLSLQMCLKAIPELSSEGVRGLRWVVPVKWAYWRMTQPCVVLGELCLMEVRNPSVLLSILVSIRIKPLLSKENNVFLHIDTAEMSGKGNKTVNLWGFLTLGLNSGFIPGCLGVGGHRLETMWHFRDPFWLWHVQGKHITISLGPANIFKQLALVIQSTDQAVEGWPQD